MNKDSVTLIHYGELSLKGRNRSLFEIKLKENIERAAGGTVKRFRGRFVLKGGDCSSLSKVFGIAWYAEAFRVNKDLESIIELILKQISQRIGDKKSFGVFVKRSDKDFPLTSMQLAEKIGSAISERYGLKVDLGSPDLSVYTEIAEEVYVYFNKIDGLRGFPVGVSGKVLSLLSGGIDSPVSSYLMMKRGCKTDFIHFHVFTENERVMRSKMNGLFRALDDFQHGSRIYLVPYYLFESAMLKLPDLKGYELILFRRYMVRVAEKIALRAGYQALVTGDSLGQVASQTLENIAHLKQAVSLPVFQPLLTYDKQEIVDLANNIGTYDISIEAYKDCCSIVSSNPKTKARARLIEVLERELNIGTLVDNTLELITVNEM